MRAACSAASWRRRSVFSACRAVSVFSYATVARIQRRRGRQQSGNAGAEEQRRTGESSAPRQRRRYAVRSEGSRPSGGRGGGRQGPPRGNRGRACAQKLRATERWPPNRRNAAELIGGTRGTYKENFTLLSGNFVSSQKFMSASREIFARGNVREMDRHARMCGLAMTGFGSQLKPACPEVRLHLVKAWLVGSVVSFW